MARSIGVEAAWHYLSSISDSKCAAYMAERNVDKLVAVTVSERG